MKALLKIITIAAFGLVTLVSCNDKQSLQEYYVDNQENGDFVLVDIPTSLISKDSDALNEEQKKVLKTVRKINIMAYQRNSTTEANYEAEKVKVNTILAGDDYEELMKANSDMGAMKLFFKGEEEAIDEMIVFVADDTKGFMLARLLGDDMNIGDMMKLAQTMEKGGIDVSQFEGVMDVFKDN
ncbi:DUF4252 domain-containing protein [Dokdonia sinensis]|uniref:DUF4252 domain-containing protein n=1 Tax=Dokdonia sinensis TaxID=2479847 RepID=A0A3M0G912_9FLAO|nr:DUF4252 domain-containing protein [Dokdonia sinensis]RMB57569.1 DUF4252 domain-containing protein [Dokdonia sinensis]